jgi:hypothetical protein
MENGRRRTHTGDEEEDGEGVDDRDEGDSHGRHDLAKRVEVEHEPQDAERSDQAEDAADGAKTSARKLRPIGSGPAERGLVREEARRVPILGPQWSASMRESSVIGMARSLWT